MMPPDDVVLELDAWLSGQRGFSINLVIQRARDEIVALRDTVKRQKAVLLKGHAEVRAEALEEAVRAIDDIAWDWPSPRNEDAEAFKAAIRALREKR